MVSITLSAKESMVNGDKNHTKNENTDDVEEEPDFSDPDGYIDHIEESELLGDILRQKPNEDEIYDKVIVVDNIPEISTDRLPKLKSVVLNYFNRSGTILSDYFPERTDPKNESVKMTKGYCFIEYDSKAAAQSAIGVMNGFSIDKQHKLFVTPFREFERLKNIDDPEEWDSPNIRPYKDMGNLRYWLLNPDCLDQFVVQYEGGDKAAVFLNGLTEPTKLAERQRWSDSFIRWSPFGTYLATVHKQGIVLWGGEKFETISKFSHNFVQFLDFSPAEKFIVTYAPPKSRYADAPDAIKIWCIRTGELKHACSAKFETCKWPKFKWSFDDNYVAVLDKENTLCVYETTKFSPVKPERDDQKIVNVRDFQWSPSELLIAFWVAEVKQTPGRVGVCDWRQKVRATKNPFSLADASIHWQKSGDHLCIKTELYKKKKVGEDGETKYINLTFQLEIFHIREKNVPVSTMEIKETITAFNWEPSGTKFALIQGDIKSLVNIYGAKHEPVAAVSLLKTLDHRGQVNSIFWSPQGNYLVCAGLKCSGNAGPLMFIDCSQEKEIALMNVQEHQGMNDLEWDPTGRFVVSMVSSWESTSRGLDYGFLVWNFQGRMLAKRQMPEFCSFSWRPRPSTLLNEEKIKSIRKNMKKYAVEFDEKDRKKLDKASQEVSERRRKQLNDFKEWREQHKVKFAEFERDRAKLRKELPENEEISEEIVEYLVSQEEIVTE